jgi:hypothetical protein
MPKEAERMKRPVVDITPVERAGRLLRADAADRRGGLAQRRRAATSGVVTVTIVCRGGTQQ